MWSFRRRTFLVAVLATTASAAISPAAHAQTRPEFVKQRDPTEPLLSANGWPIAVESDVAGGVWTRNVSGPSLMVPLQVGPVAEVLGYVVRRYHYEIAELALGDVVGFFPTDANGRESNHASGTAVDIRPGWYPLGTRDGVPAREIETIRDILAACRGLVAWGGDGSMFDVAHFDVAVPPNDPSLDALAADLRALADTPGERPGALIVDE